MSNIQPPAQPDESSEGRDKTYSEEAEMSVITMIASALERWYEQLGRQFGPLSRPQRRMLRLLSMDTKVRVSDLSEQLGVTTAGTTRMLDKLESLGYAARSRMDQYDQRQVYVTLTTDGAAALHEAERVFQERVQTLLNKLNPAERATLAHLLQLLNK
ncbi:MAG TPA: MarR family transcriptional regulator [Ktedonobacteraceae bacterium]|nr:MarR family transcriptional regulator [Ktedonobacteraceae bacterium]